MKITLKSKIRDVYGHPAGRDIIDKLLLQMNKPKRLVDNPFTGNLRLKTVQRLAGKRIGTGFFEAVLMLLNSENDAPSSVPVKTSPAWWKEAVFYQIYPRSFALNPDGSPGGLSMILSKIDYLHALGVDAVWLSPVYDSPNDDSGYDIRDYYKILPEFGTMEDMKALISGLHERGMKIVMDLVVNHTSDEHPWFKAALNDEKSPYRDFYFLRKSAGKPPNNWTSFFGGSAWNYYEEQDVWALHLFSKKQMDLNWENAAPREEIYKMVRWWLALGVDGFRLDVINYISKAAGLPDGDAFIGALMTYTGIEHYFYGPMLHKYLRELQNEAFAPYRAFSVGETPGIGAQMGRLLTDDERRELDLIFSFDHLEMPGHTRFEGCRYELTYLKRFYQERLNTDLGRGWNTLFFNNHDNPRMLSKIDPEGLYAVPLAKLLALLQMTLRGTPFIYQGDEIGAANAPFTSIDEIRDVESLGLYAELVKTMPPEKAFKKVLTGTRDHARSPLDWNEIENQRGEAGSVWNFYRKLIALRRSSGDANGSNTLIYGELAFLRPKDKTILCFTRSSPDEIYYIEANLLPKERKGKAPAGFELLLGNYDGEGCLRPYEARIYFQSLVSGSQEGI